MRCSEQEIRKDGVEEEARLDARRLYEIYLPLQQFFFQYTYQGIHLLKYNRD